MAVSGVSGRLAALWLLIWCWIGLSQSPVAAAEFVDIYKSGVAAVEAQHWTQAAELMRRAIAEQPEAKARVKKALYFRRYLPHFFLGKALYEMGDCEGALTAWRESERQEVVKRFPEYQQILDGRLACGQMVDLAGALRETLEIVETAEAAAVVSRRRLSALPETEAAVRVLRARQSQAEESLDRARARLQSGEIELSEVERVAAAVSAAKAELEIIRQQADELRVVHLATRREQIVAEALALVERARDALRSSEYLRPYPEVVRQSREAVEQALRHAREVSAGTLSVGELEAVRAELEQSTQNLQTAVAPPPSELQEAARAFLSKQYAQVLELLGAREYGSARAASSSHLLQAAALFSLYQSSGRQDEALLARAGQQVLACHTADRARRPSLALFSPTFVTFFEDHVSRYGDPSDEPEAASEI